MCAPQVKNRLIDDINEELSLILNDNHVGTMHYEDGKIEMYDRNGEYRRGRHSFLTRMKSFINKICVNEESTDFVSTNKEIKDIIDEVLKKQKLLCESGSLSVTRSMENSVLVTDSHFLTGLANAEGIANIGLIGFLLCLNFDWKQLLNISKKLKVINYANYLPLVLYKRMVDTMLDNEDELEAPSNEFQNWLISDTDSEPSSYHEDVIITLYKEVVENGLAYLNPDNILGRIPINVIEKRNPGYIQQFIYNMFGVPGDKLIETGDMV